MPLRGETVGTAYVRIIADGSEIPGDLEDQLRENEDIFDAAGRRDSKAYRKAFQDAQKDDPNWADLSGALKRGIARADVTNAFFEGEAWKNFSKDLEVQFGEAGRRASIQFGQSFSEKGSLKGLEDAIQHIHPTIAKLRKEVVAESDKIAADFEKNFKREMNSIERELKKINDDIDGELENHSRLLRKVENDFKRSWSTVRSETVKTEKVILKFTDKVKAIHNQTGTPLRRAANDFEKLSEPIGRLLGRGSRNNFLNFFGSVITNILKLGQTIFRVFDTAATVVGGFVKNAIENMQTFNKLVAEGATQAEAFAATLGTGGLEGAFATAATGGLNLALGLGALVIGFGAAAISAGALVSALILLGGIVISLAATIEFALVAALASIGPLLIPLGAIIAGIVATVVEFKDATGPLAKSIKKVKEEAKDLFKVFKDAAFKNAPALTDRVAKAMKRLDGITAAAGEGFANFATRLIDSISSPAFNRFVEAFSRFLPTAMDKLGQVIANTFEGLAGFLRASIPLSNELLDWLVKITDNFSKFTNSKKGQEEIKDFLKKAGDSAKVFGDFLGEASGLLQDLLTAGQDTGDSLFQKMADSLGRVRDYLKENPDALTNFFKDSEKFAESLGTLISDIADALDRIDTEKTRKLASDLTELFGIAVKLGGEVIAVFEGVFTAIQVAVGFAVTQLGLVIKGAIQQLGILATGIEIFGKAIPGPVGAGLRAAAGAFNDFADDAVGDIDKVLTGINDVGVEAKKTPTMDINTGPALDKLDFLNSVLQGVIRNINATNAAAAQAGHQTGSAGGTQPGPQTAPGEGTPNGGRHSADGHRVQINVTTPTKDPVAVATETVNRLVAGGFI